MIFQQNFLSNYAVENMLIRLISTCVKNLLNSEHDFFLFIIFVFLVINVNLGRVVGDGLVRLRITGLSRRVRLEPSAPVGC